MKLQKIAGICKKSGTVMIFDKENENGDSAQQYISDGHAIYPVFNMPYLEEESIMTIFDITEKQREKIHFQHENLPEAYDVNDTVRTERHADDDNDLCFLHAGRVLKPLWTKKGIVFIDTAYIKPIDGMTDEMEYFERVTPSGETYIAVKAGMLLQAVIFPFDVVSNGKFVKRIENIATMCRIAYAEAKAKNMGYECPDIDRTAFFVADPDTEENNE